MRAGSSCVLDTHSVMCLSMIFYETFTEDATSSSYFSSHNYLGREIINRKHPDCVWASQRDLLLSNQWTTSNSSTNLHIFLPFSSFLKSWGLFVLMEFKCNWHFTTFLYDVFFWREVDKIFLQWIKIIFLGFSLLSSKTDTNGKTMNKEIRLWK